MRYDGAPCDGIVQFVRRRRAAPAQAEVFLSMLLSSTACLIHVTRDCLAIDNLWCIAAEGHAPQIDSFEVCARQCRALQSQEQRLNQKMYRHVQLWWIDVKGSVVPSWSASEVQLNL